MSKVSDWHANVATLVNSVSPRVFNQRQVRTFLKEHADRLRIPASANESHVISFLTDSKLLTEVRIAPIATARNRIGEPYRTRLLYLAGSPSPYSVALALRSKSYLTHASAIHLLALSQEIPKTIYVNKEQSKKPEPKGLTQEGITRAFANRPRASGYVYSYSGYRIVLLSGKYTDWLEVTQVEREGIFYPVTKVERTLIDAVVRPNYAGGIPHVLSVYETARPRVSVRVLVATLKKLNYVYPYHQAIGFLMEKAGYSLDQCQQLRALGLNYDFYLTHHMMNPSYDHSWRIYYPSGIKFVDDV